MLVSKLTLKNWRNFTHVEVALQPRQLIVGPNACGKSNLLDVFRFLRDIAKRRGGGLQEAIERRGGLSKVRCLSARRDPEIVIGVAISDSDSRLRASRTSCSPIRTRTTDVRQRRSASCLRPYTGTCCTGSR